MRFGRLKGAKEHYEEMQRKQGGSSTSMVEYTSRIDGVHEEILIREEIDEEGDDIVINKPSSQEKLERGCTL